MRLYLLLSQLTPPSRPTFIKVREKPVPRNSPSSPCAFPYRSSKSCTYSNHLLLRFLPSSSLSPPYLLPLHRGAILFPCHPLPQPTPSPIPSPPYSFTAEYLIHFAILFPFFTPSPTPLPRCHFFSCHPLPLPSPTPLPLPHPLLHLLLHLLPHPTFHFILHPHFHYPYPFAAAVKPSQVGESERE